MPAGKDLSGGRRGASTTKKNAFCSFCRKSYRDVGPLVEGPGDVYICGECIELCQSIIDQEKRRRGNSRTLLTHIPTPRQIKEKLDQYVLTRIPRDAQDHRPYKHRRNEMFHMTS
jgi:ATP-dependent Clp protease ATP-binding subunit ClpX